MKTVTIIYKNYCPHCGSTESKMRIHSDGLISSSQEVCANCNRQYTVVESFPK